MKKGLKSENKWNQEWNLEWSESGLKESEMKYGLRNLKWIWNTIFNKRSWKWNEKWNEQ
jgi:hypothetical protein